MGICSAHLRKAGDWPPNLFFADENNSLNKAKVERASPYATCQWLNCYMTFKLRLLLNLNLFFDPNGNFIQDGQDQEPFSPYGQSYQQFRLCGSINDYFLHGVGYESSRN